MKVSIFVMIIVLLTASMCCCSPNHENDSSNIILDSSESISWNIEDATYNFIISDKRVVKNNIDGYYVLDGNDEYCFEIRDGYARWTRDLEEYSNMSGTTNRTLIIENSLDNRTYLSFEGQDPHSPFTICQEFEYSEENESFILYFNYCDTAKEPDILHFVRHE